MPASTCALALPLLYPSSSPLKGVSRGTAGGGGRLGWPAEGKATLKTRRPTQEEGLEKPLLLAWVQHRRAAAPSCPQLAGGRASLRPLAPPPHPTPHLGFTRGASTPAPWGLCLGGASTHTPWGLAWGASTPIPWGPSPGALPPPPHLGAFFWGCLHPCTLGAFAGGAPPPLHLGRLRLEMCKAH